MKSIAERFADRNQDDTSTPAQHDQLYWKKKKLWDKEKQPKKDNALPGIDRPLTHEEYVRIRQQRDKAFRGQPWERKTAMDNNASVDDIVSFLLKGMRGNFRWEDLEKDLVSSYGIDKEKAKQAVHRARIYRKDTRGR